MSTDPINWSVEEVIHQLCYRRPPIWPFAIKPCLKFENLEVALKENDVDGEVLFTLDKDSLKADLGIDSIGQRLEIVKIISFLKEHCTTRGSPPPQLFQDLVETVATAPNTTKRTFSESSVSPTKKGDPKRRRIAPTLISPSTAAEQGMREAIEEHRTKSQEGDVDSDEEDDDIAEHLADRPDLLSLLNRCQHRDQEQTFGPLGESGSEASTNTEISVSADEAIEDDEDLAITQSRSMLTTAQLNDTIDREIKHIKEAWMSKINQRVVRKAFEIWIHAAKAGTRKPALNYHEKKLRHLEERLWSQRDKIHEEIFHDVDDVKMRCRNLEATIEDIAEIHHYLDILQFDQPPPRPTTTTRRQRSERQSSNVSASDMDDLDLASDSGSAASTSLSYDLDDNWAPNLPLPNIENGVDQNLVGTAEESISAIPDDNQPEMAGPNGISENETASPGPVIQNGVSPLQVNRDKPPELGPRTPIRSNANVLQDHDLVLSQARNPLRLPDWVDSEDDVIRLSKEPNTVGSQTTPRGRQRIKGLTRETAINLGSSPSAHEVSDSSTQSFGSISTPPPKHSNLRTTRGPISKPHSQEFLPINELRARSWSSITSTHEHITALAKYIYGMDADQCRSTLAFARLIENFEVAETLQRYFRDWKNGIQRGFEGPPKADYKENLLWSFAFLHFEFYRTWTDPQLVEDDILSDAIEALEDGAITFAERFKSISSWYLNELHETSGSIVETVSAVQPLEQRSSESSTGRDSVTVEDTSDDGPTHGSKADIISIDDDDSDEDVIRFSHPQTSRRKIRKRKVATNKRVEALQKQDMERIREHQRRSEQIQKMHPVSPNKRDILISINTKDPYVYLDQHIARHIRRHQIQGVKFMWRELIEDPRHHGCLLAHTMGLGKTMQVISILCTIAQCNASSDKSVQELIPQHLRNLKTLVLCPASLLENWRDEILRWSPRGDLLGDVYLMHGSPNYKVHLLRSWFEGGGILIISYESFRSLSKYQASDEQLQADVRRWLAEGPGIVVADEAHKLKNPKSSINKSTRMFQTNSRIALTGSPLNNHLEEYHTMIDWISEGYLGNPVQFRAKYAEPIRAGLYEDSTAGDRRHAQRQLHKLKKILTPKVDRADISAISNDMPQKTEFYITLTLTESQLAAYKLVTEHISNSKSGGERIDNTRVWAFIYLLSSLCSHPSCLLNKLRERAQQQTLTTVDTPDISDVEDENNATNIEALPEDPNVSGDSVVKSVLPGVEQIFSNAIEANTTEEDPHLSHRAMVTLQILAESKRAGDKTLLFSHSLSSLNYLETMLVQMKLTYLRIDGSTNTAKRQGMTKAFNENQSSFDVLLISTRAGGLGLNLQGANRVIIYDFSFNPSWEEQAIGRAYRFGQKRPVYVYRFRTGGTFENAMHNNTIFKTQLFTRVVDHKNVVRAASQNLEKYLHAPKEVPREDFSEAREKGDVVLNKILENNPDHIRNIVLTETFQREDANDELTAEEQADVEAELAMEQTMEGDHVLRQKHPRPKWNVSAENIFMPIPNAYPVPRPTRTMDDSGLHFA